MRPLSLAALLLFSTALTAPTQRPVPAENEGAVAPAASRPLRDIEAERWGDPGHGSTDFAPAVIVGDPAVSSGLVNELGEPLVDVTPTFAVSNRNAIDYIVGN